MKKLGVNCQTCGTGSLWWFEHRDKSMTCLNCDKDPLVKSSRVDWRDYIRAKMVVRFGPRLLGDSELLTKYRDELEGAN